MKRFFLTLITLMVLGVSTHYATVYHIGESFDTDVVFKDTVISIEDYICCTFKGNVTMINTIVLKGAFDESSFKGDFTAVDCILPDNLLSYISVKGAIDIDDSSILYQSGWPVVSGPIFDEDVVIEEDEYYTDRYKNAVFMRNLTIRSESVPPEAFSGVIVKGDLTIESSDIGSKGFSHIVVGGNLAFGNSVTSIGSNAFYTLEAPHSDLTLPQSIQKIEERAFYNPLIKGESLILSFTECQLGDFAFQWAPVHELILRGKIGLGLGVFSYSRVQSVTLPSSLDEISGSLFSGCADLKQVNLASLVNLKEIGAFAFRGTGLIEVSFPQNLSIIGASAFQACPLTTIVLPKNIKSIGKLAFEQTDRMAYGQWAMLPKQSRLIYIPEAKEEQFDFSQSGFNTTDRFVIWASPGNDKALPLIENNYDYYLSWVLSYDEHGGSARVYPDWATAASYGETNSTMYNLLGQDKWDNEYHEYFATGKVYVPQGLKTYLQSLVPPEPSYMGLSDFYRYLGILPDDHWIEVEMGDYPNCDLNPYSEGVEQVGAGASDAVEVARYDISGRLLDKPAQGINIVRFSDGTIKKEFVK